MRGERWIFFSLDQILAAGLSVIVLLTDKYPQPAVVQKLAAASPLGIEYIPEPVDAMQVPPHLKGMRALFEGFHHFKPQQARLILQDALENRVAIGVFEASLKPPLGLFLLLLAPLMTLAGYLFATPFIKPRTFSRFFWTYLIPIVPLATFCVGAPNFLPGCLAAPAS